MNLAKLQFIGIIVLVNYQPRSSMSFEIDINAVQKAATAAIIERVKNVRCPEHGQYAKIVAKGSDKFEVSGCCDRLIADVRARLK